MEIFHWEDQRQGFFFYLSIVFHACMLMMPPKLTYIGILILLIDAQSKVNIVC